LFEVIYKYFYRFLNAPPTMPALPALCSSFARTPADRRSALPSELKLTEVHNIAVGQIEAAREAVRAQAGSAAKQNRLYICRKCPFKYPHQYLYKHPAFSQEILIMFFEGV
jgi:hypothetical protein